MNKYHVFLLKVIFTVVLFYIIIQKVNIDQLPGLLKGANYFYFVLMCIIWIIGLALSSIKWNIILKEYRISISNKEAFDLYWISSFFNNFLPSSFGGDSYKFICLNNSFKQKKSQIISSIILERGFGFLANILLIFIFSFIFIKELIYSPNQIVLIIVGTVLIVLTICLFLFKRGREIKYVSNYKFINKLMNGLNVLLSFNNRRILFISLLISSVFLLLSILSLSFAFRAFNYDVSFSLLLFIVPMIQLSGLIPFSINSLGISEGIGVYLFIIFGVNPQVALLVLLSSRVLFALCTLTGGLKYIFKKSGTKLQSKVL